MKTEVSVSGLEFNKIINPNFTIGIRKDGIKEKLFGIRPKSADNHNYQFEITFQEFKTPTITLEDIIKTDYEDIDGIIDISDKTVIKYSESSTKHLINVSGIEDDLYYGKYLINHTGYCFCPNNELFDINYEIPFMKGLKFCSEDPEIEINDLDLKNYIYIWIGEDCIHTSETELTHYLNDQNPYASLEDLIFLYGDYTEPISWDWFLDNMGVYNINKLKYVRKQLMFKARNIMTDKLTIKNPSFLDNQMNTYEISLDHYVYQIDDNTMYYFKIPSLINILVTGFRNNSII